jgi:chromosome segregation ATPase
VSDVSSLDMLEQKIGQALERLQQMSRENQELQHRLRELEAEKSGMQAELQRLNERLGEAEHQGADLHSLRGRVDGILAKFELLEL